MENEIRVVVAIVQRQNRVLLVQRTLKAGVLNWQFPAGKIEKGEEQFNAAEREVHEETGVRCKAIKDLGHRVHPINNVLIYYIICDYISGKEHVKDHREIKTISWVNPSDLKAYIPENMYPGIIDYFELSD